MSKPRKGGERPAAPADEPEEPAMKYRDFLEGVGAAIFAIDLEGKFLFVNEQALQLLGYGEEGESELVGQHFSKIMAPDQAPAAMNLLQSGREVHPAVLEALRKDGTPITLEVSGAWVRRRGRRVGALAMAWETGAAAAGAAQELSKLDMTILQLLSSGLSNREIAQRVYLSTHTIKDRIERMMRSFDVHRRTELAAKAARQGLV
jgi:PAS domain S-box-containing protein